MVRKHNRELVLGKKPARDDAIQLKLHSYMMRAVSLPKPPDPRNFGQQGLVGTNGWGMLGNDSAGDCVWAGAAHETMLANRIASRSVKFTTKSVLSDYAAVTGYDPRKPETDQGTDMQVAASYRRKTGVLDSVGHRHKITAYLAGRKGNINDVLTGAYVFAFAGIGIEFPEYAMDQFNRGEVWDVQPHAALPDGGHYVPVVGVENGNLVVVTWGRRQLMTPAFFKKYNDEAVIYLTDEYLTGGKSPLGLDVDALEKDLAQVVKQAA